MKTKLCVLVPILVITFLLIDETSAQTTKPTGSLHATKTKSNKEENGNPSGTKKITFSSTPTFQPPAATGDLSGISPFYILLWLIVHFSPTLVACVKKRKNPVHGSFLLVNVAIVNTFFGWFCLGWVVAWILVITNFFGRLSPGREISSFGSGGTTTGYTFPVDSTNDFSTPERQVCSICHGTGQKPCSSCWGRGSWHEQPQTADGVARLVSCSFCCASGKVQCTH